MSPPLTVFLTGALLGVSLAAPPGPIMAIMATAAVRGRVKESIHTALGAITGDACWLTLVTAGFLAFLRGHARAVAALGLAGGAMLLWMAWATLRATRRGLEESAVRGSYKVGVGTVLLSPFSFAWWIGAGPMLLHKLGAPGIAGLFGALVAYTVVVTYALRWLGARMRHTGAAVAYLSAAILALFGFYFLRESVRILAGGAGG